MIPTTHTAPNSLQITVTLQGPDRPTAVTDPLVRAETAAALLGITTSRLTKWRRTRPGIGPRAFKRGQHLRYRISDLQAWLDAQPENDRVLTVNSRPSVLDLQEASEYLQIPASSITTWRSRQPEYAPPGYKDGQHLRFHLQALNTWVEAHLEPMRLPESQADPAVHDGV